MRNLILGTILTCLAVIYLPGLHYRYIRNSTSATVVRITEESGNSGGTGFHVKGPSGKTYILSNAHVCGVQDDEGFVYVGKTPERKVKRKVIEVSKVSDLCLIEPLVDEPALNVSSGVSFGEIVAVVGHPSLMGVTMTRGELVGIQNIDLFSHLIDPENKEDCTNDNNTKVESFFGPVCLVSFKSYRSNILIQPGNSGSPLVNFYGNLVAVAFASDSRGWGFFVTLDQIEDFLSIY